MILSGFTPKRSDLETPKFTPSGPSCGIGFFSWLVLNQPILPKLSLVLSAHLLVEFNNQNLDKVGIGISFTDTPNVQMDFVPPLTPPARPQ
jgi:hypothetical protein